MRAQGQARLADDRRNRYPRSRPGSWSLGDGFGTKLHAVVDALGLPVRFEIGPDQQNDMAPAGSLVEGLAAGQVIADRAYTYSLAPCRYCLIVSMKARKVDGTWR